MGFHTHFQCAKSWQFTKFWDTVQTPALEFVCLHASRGQCGLARPSRCKLKLHNFGLPTPLLYMFHGKNTEEKPWFPTTRVQVRLLPPDKASRSSLVGDKYRLTAAAEVNCSVNFWGRSYVHWLNSCFGKLEMPQAKWWLNQQKIGLTRWFYQEICGLEQNYIGFTLLSLGHSLLLIFSINHCQPFLAWNQPVLTLSSH